MNVYMYISFCIRWIFHTNGLQINVFLSFFFLFFPFFPSLPLSFCFSIRSIFYLDKDYTTLTFVD